MPNKTLCSYWEIILEAKRLEELGKILLLSDKCVNAQTTSATRVTMAATQGTPISLEAIDANP